MTDRRRYDADERPGGAVRRRSRSPRDHWRERQPPYERDDDRRRPRPRYDDADGAGERRYYDDRRGPSRRDGGDDRRTGGGRREYDDDHRRAPPGRRRSPPPPSSSNALARRSMSPLSRARELEALDRRSGGGGDGGEPTPPDEDAGKPNFGLSGKLAAETNLYKGVVLKYNEPAEARKPGKNWRVYVFKGQEEVNLWHLHRQSAFLIGRDRVVADIPVDHPSTSKQHAVIQFRQTRERNEFGDTKTLIKPFIIDLESANGTTVNDEKLPPSRYYELKSGDGPLSPTF